MKFNVSSAFMMLCTLAFVSCDSGGSDRGPKNPISVLVMGDSQSSGGNYSGVPPWSALLAAEKPEWRVINQAIAGETSAGGASRIRGALQRHSPDVVVMMYGANDAIQSRSQADYEQNILNMIASAKAAGARVVLVNVMPIFGARSIYNGTAEALNTRLIGIAARERVQLANVSREFRAEGSKALFPDGLHPNLDATRILMVGILEKINAAASDL
ncbi:MAG: hypothetical protein JJU05_13165 [Verrucomicrobia bacterium]|nr:hypothetical protein [Verrucomicrobiota bacterium]MCH8528941.1 GDSL-type esterase/lipase family protein [Kiritimatiellia bacterium]